jgi:putative hydrolase of the HAD superfamily
MRSDHESMTDNHSKPDPDIEAVIFDYGEVLCHAPTAEQKARLAGFFGISVDRLPTLWERNRGPYDRGDLTPQDYWSRLAADAGREIHPHQIDEICELDLAMWSTVNVEMVNWALELGASGLKVGLLSNMHPQTVAHCRRQFAWLNRFNSLTFSGDVRLIKPDRAIYERALRDLGAKASETLFLDDREPNVRSAKQLGMRAIHFHSIAQLRDELEAAGFPILPQIPS